MPDQFGGIAVEQPRTDQFGGISLADAPSAKTTTRGVIDAVSRGLAPYALGATAGAAVGAPFGGVGAIPGALMGAGSVAAEELASAAYNPFARLAGWKELPSASEMVGRGMDALGFAKPDTAAERIVQATAGGAGSALSGSGAAKVIAERAAPGIGRMLATQFSDLSPTAQAVSGASAGAAGEGTAEAGGGPILQTLAAVAAGGLPIAAAHGGKAVLRSGVRGSGPTDAATAAHDAGFTLPAQMASDKPGWVADLLSGWGGKVKAQQSASMKNADRVNQLAAEALGLDGETDLSGGEATSGVRRQAGKAYSALSEAQPGMVVDQPFIDAATDLMGPNTQLVKYFPKTSDHPEINALVSDLTKLRDVPTDVMVEKVKQLRTDGRGNQSGPYDPGRRALGRAQIKAADAIEGLIERNLAGKAVSVELPVADPQSIPAPREEAIPGLITTEQAQPKTGGRDLRRSPTMRVPGLGGAKNFLKWVQQRGGIKDTDGKVAKMYRDAGKLVPPGVIANQNGTPLDVLANRAQSAGYIGSNVAGAESAGPQELTGEHVLDLLRSHVDEGQPVYSENDLNAVQARDAARTHNADVKRLAEQYGIDYRGMTADQVGEAARRAADFLDRADKLKITLKGDELPEEIAALVHEREGMMQQPGTSADAIQSHNDLMFGGTGLPENYDVLEWLHEPDSGSLPGREDSAQSSAVGSSSASVGGRTTAGNDAAQGGGNGPLGSSRTQDEAAGLVAAYRQARTQIAKAHTVEDVTNETTGDVSARGLGRLLARGKPLSGELKTIASAARAFPKAFQDRAAVGGVSAFSPLDLATGLIAAKVNPSSWAEVLGVLAGRPAARAIMLSPAFQRAMAGAADIAPPKSAAVPVGPFSGDVLAEKARKKGNK